jgi:hypothetical protein
LIYNEWYDIVKQGNIVAINFLIKDNILLLEYSAYDGRDWVRPEFESGNSVTISKTFIFKKEDLYVEDIDEDEFDYDESSVLLIFGKLDIDKKYYKIEGRIFNIPYNVYFDKDIKAYPNYFIDSSGISIFRHIAKVITGDIKICLEDDVGIKFETFNRLIERFPNSYELRLYAEKRISSIIKDEFEKVKNIEKKYEDYMSKKYSKKEMIVDTSFKKSEMSKYEYIYKVLSEMLIDQELYTEPVWQKQILEILTIIFPKYLYSLREVPVKDYYDAKKRKIDFVLIDYNGNMDIIEIKRPYDDPILTNNTYRDNYVPLRELSGSVMQIEKYIFHLTKGGKRAEEVINKYFHDKITSSLKIKIINPTGIIILGRDSSINNKQMNDFEIIKRKYKNIIDIITYDDLLLRLKRIIEKYSS